MSASSSGSDVAGHFQATENYPSLFIFATVGNFGAIVLAFFNWKTLTDRNTPLLDATRKQFQVRQIVGLGIVIGLVPVVWFMLQRPGSTSDTVQGDLRWSRAHADLPHRSPPGSP